VERPEELCVVCGGPVRLRAEDGFRTARCRACGVVYVSPPLSAENALELYGDGTIFTGGSRARVFALVDRLLRERIGEKGTILDVGCGAGGLLSLAVERGWNAVGIDINRGAVAAARERGLEAFVSRIEDFEPQGGGFDGIVMLNALEYFSDPVAALERSVLLLRAGGVLVVEMPNADYHRWQTAIGRALRLPREQLMFVAPTSSRRLFAFGPRALERALLTAGFSKVEIYPSAPRDRGGLVERLLRRSIFRVSKLLFAASRGRVVVPPAIVAVATKDTRD
jgi:2-polyprenyl-3-methyl-5-hydroxy-6-metoxy-1,4-benzoquinol methylase